MSSKIARQGSQQNPDEPARLLNYNAFADLRGLGWDSVKELIEAAPIEVRPECHEIIVSNPRALLTLFTQNPAVAQWIPESAQQGVTFERFTHEIFEPYILPEVGRRSQEAQSHCNALSKTNMPTSRPRWRKWLHSGWKRCNASSDNR